MSKPAFGAFGDGVPFDHDEQVAAQAKQDYDPANDPANFDAIYDAAELD